MRILQSFFLRVLCASVVNTSFCFAAAPVLSGIAPRGGQRGTEVVLTFAGARLADAQEVMAYSPGFQVTKLDAKDNQVQATVKIAADCRLGSPLDPVLYVYNAQGGALAGNDDIPGSPDSYLRFTVPADGEYLLSVTDHLKKGGPTYSYRVEVPPGHEHMYGIIAGDRDAHGRIRIRDMVEKPKSNPPSRMAIVGRYVLPPAIWGHLAATKPGAGGSFTFFLLPPVGSPRKRTSTSSPGRPPGGNTASGRGKVPTCSR